MFQNTIIEIIKRIEKLTQNKKSIIELDIEDIKEEIHETLFQIDFTEDELKNDEIKNIEEIKKLGVTTKEAFGVLFLTFVATLRNELSYNTLWEGIQDALLEFEEDDNTFFEDNYFDDNEPNAYLNEAIIEAISKFNLRDGYDNGKPTDTVLLQIGILKRCTNLNYWLLSTSKNAIIENLTNRTSENFSSTFFKGWKVIQRYSQSLLSKERAIILLRNNVWYKDLNLEELLTLSREKLHSTLLSQDEIENNFFLQSVKYVNKKLQFMINGDDFYILNLNDDTYDIFVDGKLQTLLLKDRSTNTFYLENSVCITEPEKYKIRIEIKDKNEKLVYEDDFVLFDFNHDILIFDEDGKWYKDPNSKLDDTKKYSLLIDSDFEIGEFEDDAIDYFDGYVYLINEITKDSNFNADDGEKYQFCLNFSKQIKAPLWLNNLELYASSDFLSFDEPIEYQLRYNNISVSARQVNELMDIFQDASILRWSYTGGVIYDLDKIVNFNYDMDLTPDILINRKNSLKIKVGNKTFTKNLNVTLIEKTIRPKYRTFLRHKNDNITFLKQSNKLTQNDIKNNQIIITSFHEEFITEPTQKTQILRDKSNIFDEFMLNKFFTLSNYPYYGEEISNVKKIYDDVRWNTFCSVSINGIVKNYDEKTSLATLCGENILTTLTLITLDKSYTLNTQKLDINSNEISIPTDILAFCLIDEEKYVGSYFKSEPLDINIVFNSVEILKFLRASYYPLAEYFNDTGYEKNRMVREKARHDKKIAKRELRVCIKNNPSVFLKAFMDEEFVIDETSVMLNFDHSKAIVEQILFAIEFDSDNALSIINEIILNRWQSKMIQLPMFLLFLLNRVENDRYYDIFLDELSENISTPNDVDEDFIERMIKALLSNHKIDKFEKVNIKTITQGKNKDFYIQKTIERIIERNNTPKEENEEENLNEE